MKSLSNKNPLNIISKILGWAFKVTAILLGIFLFIGVLNPARFTTNINNDVSVIKSAFYFQTYAQGLVEAEKKASEEAAAAKEETNTTSDATQDDYYSNIAALMNSSLDSFNKASTVSDDDDSLSFNKAGKIKAENFGKIWDAFSEKYEPLAKAINFGHVASIFTFIFVALTILGVFLSLASGKIKKLGNLVTVGGAVLTALSMIFYAVATKSLDGNLPAFVELVSVKPLITVFVIFSVITAVCAAGVFVTEKVPEDEPTALSERPFQWTYRILALLIFVLMFIPAANPARISSEISRTVSLFTSAISWPTYTKNIQRAFIRGWLPEYVLRIANISSILVLLGIVACGAGSCMSIGNNKLKRIAHYTLFGGEVVAFASLFGIRHAYNLVCSNPSVAKVPPLEPACFTAYLVLLAVMFCCTLVSFLKTPAPEPDEKCHIEAQYQLFLMLLPFLILVFLFSYLPLWGWRYAFFDYNPGETLSMDKWTGWKWFVEVFRNDARRADLIRVLRNTLVMSGLGIAFSWLPMIFAIFLAEIKSTAARKVIQTLTTIPNFISWVLVYAIAFCIFGTDGFISSLMIKAGVWTEGKNMLMGDSFIWLKMWAWGTWKGLGWSAIMYIAAISGIDQQLYEAATVDGAGRFQKIWHITIPELLPTYLVLLILSVSNILSNGMDQYLVFKNPTNQKPIEVLDLYVYNLTFGTSSSMIPFSTVVSMFKSLISVILLFITNRISKLIRGSSIF